MQELRFADPRQARDEDVEQNQNHIGRMIIAPRRPRLEDAFEPSPQTELVAKTLDEEEAAEVSQGLRFERKIQCLQAFAHVCRAEQPHFRVAPITYHLGRLLARAKKCSLPAANGRLVLALGTKRASFNLNLAPREREVLDCADGN